ncbi:hypothetical protein FAZ95_05705 [Trinickia violacea]|uniref:Uncharacterized protein n=1 Tax=Trinickia violacea TaxID=2571746 RepID=A0A4P8IJ09_9BURK|nr:hypothetical protein [Trinickia violacea]QCP48728.1 hypothetical protein FAZ95_05705 [Trinickia violacea]
MSDEHAQWQMEAYEGFEIHVAPFVKGQPENQAPQPGDRYTYIGYVCHPGADPKLPGHSVPFHADGEETFKSAADALYEGVHIGRSIVDGTHPDLTVLPLVTGGV